MIFRNIPTNTPKNAFATSSCVTSNFHFWKITGILSTMKPEIEVKIMKLNEKIILLRKEKGYSQEDLASQLDVSRQSVSKWELGSAVPEINKIVLLSELFQVSTDYLIKDDETWDEESLDLPKIPYLSIQRVDAFLKFMQLKRKIMTGCIPLFILSPIPLLLLGGYSQTYPKILNEDMAGVTGVCILLVLVGIGTCFMVLMGHEEDSFEDVLNQPIYLPGYMKSRLTSKKEEFRTSYNFMMTIGVVLCILAAIPILLGSMVFENNEFYMLITLCMTLVIIAVGVSLFMNATTQQECYDALLQTGEYSVEAKEFKKAAKPFTVVFWIAAVILYCILLFLNLHSWQMALGFFSIAALLYGAVIVIWQQKYIKK